MLQVFHAGIRQALVVGEDDLHAVPAVQAGPGQASYHIAQPPDLCRIQQQSWKF